MREILKQWTMHTLPAEYAWAGVVVLALLTLLSLASLRAVKAPGPVNDRERKARGRGRRWGLLTRLYLIVMTLTLIGGAAYLFLPILPPRILVLSSRSRPVDDVGWDDEWKAYLAGKFPGEGRFLDAGPVVDAICDRLVRRADAGEVWETSDLDSMGRLRREVRLAIEEGDLDRSVVTDKLPSVGRSVSLPPWVVQSVEMSVLRALTSVHNVRAIGAQFPDVSVGSSFRWEDVAPLLADQADRWEPTRVDVKGAAETSGIQLIRALAVRRLPVASGPPEVAVDCLFRVAGPAGPRDVPVIMTPLDPAAGFSDASATVHLPGTAVPTVVVGTALFAGIDPGATLDPAAIRIDDARSPARRVPRDPNAFPEIELVYRGPNPNPWPSTLDALRSPTAPPSVAQWVGRMKEARLDPARLRFVAASGTTAGPARIVLDEQMAPGALFIYPAGQAPTPAAGDPAPIPPIATSGTPQPPTRVPRVQAIGDSPPGVDSWEGLALADRPLKRWAGARQPPLGQRWAIGPGVRGGVVFELGEPEVAFVFRDKVAATGPTAPGHAVVTLIGLDFLAQGMLIPPLAPPGTSDYVELDRALVGWTAVLDGIYHAVAGNLGTSADESRPPRDDRPLLLLDADTLESVRAVRLTWCLIILSSGVAAYALFLARGLRSAPGRANS